MEETARIRTRSFSWILWALSLFCIPLLSFFGRSLQFCTYQYFSLEQLGIALALVMAGLISVFFIALFKSGGKHYLWHLLWVGALSYLLYNSLPFVEKIHIALFGLFGFFSQRLFRQRMAIAACIGISFLDELLQHFLAARVGDWRDVWLNLFSASLGMLLAFFLLEGSGGQSEKSPGER